jgi:hypothetical protein
MPGKQTINKTFRLRSWLDRRSDRGEILAKGTGRKVLSAE